MTALIDTDEMIKKSIVTVSEKKKEKIRRFIENPDFLKR